MKWIHFNEAGDFSKRRAYPEPEKGKKHVQMRATTLFFILIFVKTFCWGQNLVPNPSFEEYIECPDNLSDNGAYQLDKCAHWYTPTLATSDYFHGCANFNNPMVGVPQNLLGFQEAYDGEAYAGFLAYAMWSGYYWYEYIQVRLMQPLQKDSLYRVSFHVSLGDDISAYAVKRIGAYLSKEDFTPSVFGPLNLDPQVCSPDDFYLTDEQNWSEISGLFFAQGGEEYLTIGRFGDSIQVDTMVVNLNVSIAPGPMAYYYVDMVKVELISNLPAIPNVFTPNEDGINDFFFWPAINEVKWKMSIHNRWGRRILEANENDPNYWDGKDFDGFDCSEGIYFYVFTLTDSNSKQSGFVHLFR